MRWTGIKLWTLTLSTSLILTGILFPAAGAIKAGSPCKKVEKVRVVKGVTFECMKFKKQKTWRRVSSSSKERPEVKTNPESTTNSNQTTSIGTVDPSPLLVDAPDPLQYSANPNFCKLKDQTSDERRKLTPVGFPMVKDRLKAKGTISAIFIAVDFSDLPSLETMSEQLTPFSEAAEEYFEFISGGKIQWQSEFYSQIIRANNPSDFYKIDRYKFGFGKTDYLSIRKEIISRIEEGGLNLSIYDLVAFVPPRYTTIGGPAFLETSDTSFRGINGPILNSVFFGWFFPPEYMVAHEIGHLFGLNHVDDRKTNSSARLSTSGWDVMANDGSVMSYFGWHKWLLGWIDDDQVVCITQFPSTPIRLRIDQIDAFSQSRKLIVIPQSLSRAIVIESRRSNRFDVPMPSRTSVDRSPSEFGVIAYMVDMAKSWEEGTMRILGNPSLNPWGQKNGIRKDENLVFEGYKISVLATDDFGDFIEVLFE